MSHLFVSLNCDICKEVLFLVNKCPPLSNQLVMHVLGKEKFPPYIKTVPFLETQHHSEPRMARYTGEDVVAWVKHKLQQYEAAQLQGSGGGSGQRQQRGPPPPQQTNRNRPVQGQQGQRGGQQQLQRQPPVQQQQLMDYDPMSFGGAYASTFAGVDIENVAKLDNQKSIIPETSMDAFFNTQQQFSSVDESRNTQSSGGKKTDNSDGERLVNDLMSVRQQEEAQLKARMAAQSGGMNIMPPQQPNRPT